MKKNEVRKAIEAALARPPYSGAEVTKLEYYSGRNLITVRWVDKSMRKMPVTDKYTVDHLLSETNLD